MNRTGVWNMKDVEQIRRELARQGKEQELGRLAGSADGQKIAQTLGGDLERAAQAGDAAAMSEALQKLLRTGEGQRLAGELRRLMNR